MPRIHMMVTIYEEAATASYAIETLCSWAISDEKRAPIQASKNCNIHTGITDFSSRCNENGPGRQSRNFFLDFSMPYPMIWE